MMINWIVNWRRFLKRKNYSKHTVKNYLSLLRQFILWLNVPLEEATNRHAQAYTDMLLDRGLKPKTINCHLDSIRLFYDYLYHEEGQKITNPIQRGYRLRLPKPLPRHLKDEEVDRLMKHISRPRDKAIFFLMLRCGLRVEEVANLTLGCLDLKRKRMVVEKGKGGKGRVVYISHDAMETLVRYLRMRGKSGSNKVFLVEKGTYTGCPISVRGIQKRLEYYSKKAGLAVSCHQLRHTMATQLLNAEAELVTIQDLLGHNWITTTQRYCRVSNIKVQKDYFRAIQEVIRKQGPDTPTQRLQPASAAAAAPTS